MNSNKLDSRIIKTELVNWRQFQFIQQQDFKDLSAEAKQKLKNSVLENNFTQPFYVWYDTENNTLYCLDGKHRTNILNELIAEQYDIPDMLPATFIYCNNKKEAAKLVLIYSSMYAKVTGSGLFDFIKLNDLDFKELETTIDLPGLDGFEFESLFTCGKDKTTIPSSLTERFLIPPFSVIDARQGYWQDRKKIWNSLFNSQETREDIDLIAKSGQAPAIYELRNKMRESLSREPTWNEILQRAEEKGMHIYSGASVFDPVLAEVLYTWFCPKDAKIIDPFAGGSVRGIVAAVMGHNYVGIDLREDQCQANIHQLGLLEKVTGKAKWEIGDSKEKLDDITEYFDFCFSCPPYHNLEKYSDDPNDLSNMGYAEFCNAYREIIIKSIEKLKPNRFACFVVGEIRDKQTGYYRDFVGQTINSFKEAGMNYYNEIILITVAGSLPVRVGRQFEKGRKVGKTHQNVLVFYKGDPQKIKEEFPDIKITEYLQELNYQPNIALSIFDD